MISSFPKPFSNKAIAVYLVALLSVSTFFVDYAMSIKFILIGVVSVVGFFSLSWVLTERYQDYPTTKFLQNIFGTALLLRIAWVVFSYFFYIRHTGQPFEWDAADSVMYHEESSFFCHGMTWSFQHLNQYFHWLPYSDKGYFFYLSTIYSIFGDSIIVARLIKALLSAFTCVLIYRLASRNFGESTGRMAAVFCMLMPNLIYYCGIHMKETEMLFLVVAYLERADYLLRSKQYSFINIALPILLAISLFFFRSVLGAIAVVAFFTSLLFSSSNIVGRSKKILLIVWGLVVVGYLAGGTIMTEIETTWEDRGTNQDAKRQMQVEKGVEWAKYATGAVMAPIIFVVPFSTMVDVDEQYNQQVLHGGNFVKNVLGIFVLIALIYALFVHKNWRDFSLIGAFAIGYLLVIAFSGFANAERFHLPALPCLLMMAAYGVSLVNEKNIKYVNYWLVLVLVMEFAWAFFKLGSRGIVG